MAGEIVPFEQKVQSVRKLLDQLRPQLALALPRHLTPERLVRVTLTEILRTPKLLDCDWRTLAGAILQAGALGLEPGLLGLAYLVPFGTTVTLIPGYKGLLALARRSGQIKSIEARIVHAKDTFHVAFGTESKITHRPFEKPEDPGQMVAAYAVAHLKDGACQFDFMWKRDLDEIRKRSRASQEGPWVTDYGEMAKKTVLRRLCKLLPASIDLQTAVVLDELAEVGKPQGLGALVEVDSIGLDANGQPTTTAKPSKLDTFAGTAAPPPTATTKTERPGPVQASPTSPGPVVTGDPPPGPASGGTPSASEPKESGSPASTADGPPSPSADRGSPASGPPVRPDTGGTPPPPAPERSRRTRTPQPPPGGAATLGDAVNGSAEIREAALKALEAMQPGASDALEEFRNAIYHADTWRKLLPADRVLINRAFAATIQRVEEAAEGATP